MARVSAIVPLYNKATTVRRTMNSITAQSFRDWEVIVVDDGSTDEGPATVEQMNDPRFRLIRQTNAGPGAARNRGIRESRGEYLAFLDADDEWLPDYLQNAVDILEGPSRAAAVACLWIDEPGHIKGPVFEGHLREGPMKLEPGLPPLRLVEWLIVFSPCSTVARRQTVERFGGFYDRDGCRYGEDAHLWLKIFLNETCYLSLKHLAIFHRDASELSNNLSGMRPIEPFLANPEDVQVVCPQRLQPLLSQFLSYRAQKTACLLSYWGDGKAAWQLLRRFSAAGDWRLPWFFPARISSAPFLTGCVSGLAQVYRTVRSRSARSGNR